MSYPSRRSLNSTVKQVLTDQPEYVVRFWRTDFTRLNSVVHRFRILVVGKASLYNAQRSPGQTNGLVITERLREILAYQ
jgi:hypothetical protein